MGGNNSRVPEAMRKLVEERVTVLEQRMGREIDVLLQCKHGLSADRCSGCKGMTALGVSADVVVEVLTQRGYITVELDARIPSRTGPVRHQRPLKTVLGVGIGAGFFLAFAGWRGGKRLLRLISRTTDPGAS